MKLRFILALFLAVNSAAFAQSGKQYYGGLEYGASRVPNDTNELATTLVSNLGGRATVSQNLQVGTARAFLGYRINDQLSLEGGVFASSKINFDFSGVTRFGNSYSGNADVDFTGIDLSALWYPSGGSSAFEGFFLKAGIHSSKTSATTTLRGLGNTSSTTEDESGSGALFGLGYDWRFGVDSFLRWGVTQYQSIGGNSEAKGTYYSIGVGTRF